jgi:hypothetical protein
MDNTSMTAITSSPELQYVSLSILLASMVVTVGGLVFCWRKFNKHFTQ